MLNLLGIDKSCIVIYYKGINKEAQMGGLFSKLFKRKQKETQIIAEDEIEEESQEDILERYRYENRNKKLQEETKNLKQEEPILNGLTLYSDSNIIFSSSEANSYK